MISTIVSTALSVAPNLVNRVHRFLSRKRRRQEQVEFLRDKILYRFEYIGKIKPSIDVNGHRPDNAIPKRAACFDHFLREMEIVVDCRIPDLEYSEIAEIRSTVADARSWLKSELASDDWEDLVRYGCIYRSFQKIKWLELPPKFPWRMPEDPLLRTLQDALKSVESSESNKS